MKIGNREFQTKGHTYVMGILNVTPDSFSDGGKWNDRDKALRHVEEMLREGADIIDIGGESTRPGYTYVPEEEEIARVTPVIRAVKAAFDVPVSLDTYKAAVAEAGIQAGADLINDVWGLKFECGHPNIEMSARQGQTWGRRHESRSGNGMDMPKDKQDHGAGNGAAGTDREKGSPMAQVIASSGLPCCLMHNRRDQDYRNFLQDVTEDLKESLDLAARAGISREKIILDPGVGFAKSYEQNLEIIRRMEELEALGCPLLLGCSRKSVIGLTLDLPADQRLEGTLVTTVAGVMKGAMFVRVHDVKENVRAVRMAEAIWPRAQV